MRSDAHSMLETLVDLELQTSGNLFSTVVSVLWDAQRKAERDERTASDLKSEKWGALSFLHCRGRRRLWLPSTEVLFRFIESIYYSCVQPGSRY